MYTLCQQPLFHAFNFFGQFCSALFIFRVSADAEERKHFISWCQDVGILEVLPYHECDPLSRDQPDYLSCMIRLQVQNISSRYSVFVTGKLQSDCSYLQFFSYVVMIVGSLFLHNVNMDFFSYLFLTDKAVDSSFGKNGILTFTLESFLTCCPSKLFAV